jgi:hypothetical protein
MEANSAEDKRSGRETSVMQVSHVVTKEYEVQTHNPLGPHPDPNSFCS